MRANETSTTDPRHTAQLRGQVLVAVANFRYAHWQTYGADYQSHRERAGYEAYHTKVEAGDYHRAQTSDCQSHLKVMHEAPARMGVAGSEGYDERCAKAAGVQVRTGTSLWEELWSAVQNMLTTAERKDILMQGEQGEETMMDSQWKSQQEADRIAKLTSRALVMHHRAGRSIHLPTSDTDIATNKTLHLLRVARVTPGYNYYEVEVDDATQKRVSIDIISMTAARSAVAAFVCLGFSLLPPDPEAGANWPQTKDNKEPTGNSRKKRTAWHVIASRLGHRDPGACATSLKELDMAATVVSKCIKANIPTVNVIVRWFNELIKHRPPVPAAKWNVRFDESGCMLTKVPLDLPWRKDASSGYLIGPEATDKQTWRPPLAGGPYAQAVIVRISAGMTMAIADLLGTAEGEWLIQVADHTYAPVVVMRTEISGLPHRSNVRTLPAPGWLAGNGRQDMSSLWISTRADTTLILATQNVMPPPAESEEQTSIATMNDQGQDSDSCRPDISVRMTTTGAYV